ncbi:uncharacterized protein J4E84_003986 [Alternaria hordeiaustralica]|uniref:uncharacterized protein n=1 Tax=Alternaria hordeiaustralica TaxID=1187925 RepID=UPI0020C32E16|nr:uncharacterized protein J4E84_003986 [Alternaria hordeiaustralica]KAI4689806.1 hypothetical protein J4E84_003986 [Alternaria hordeiaustralica]
MEAERAKNEIDQHDKDYEEAKRQIQRLCPDGICVEAEDLILWEFRGLEQTYAEAQLKPDTKTLCERCPWRLDERFYDRHLSSDQHASCVTRVNLERHWLELAYQQSRADALAHCARSDKNLLPPASFETIASIYIADYESKYHGWKIEDIKKALSGDIGDEALLELWSRLEVLVEPRSSSDDRLYD